jgi:hypothetical protein
MLSADPNTGCCQVFTPEQVRFGKLGSVEWSACSTAWHSPGSQPANVREHPELTGSGPERLNYLSAVRAPPD